MTNDHSCIVMSVRADREKVVIKTTDGEIVLRLTPQGRNKTKTVITAPRSVPINRRPLEEIAHDAV